MKLFLKLFVLFVLITFSIGTVFSQSKKNSRPVENAPAETNVELDKEFQYKYEFSQPKFLITKVVIVHDKNGIGTITFLKREYDEDFVEPIKLTNKSLETLKEHWDKLDFLNSEEIYQTKDKDFSHLGTIKLGLRKNSKERNVEFNWSENVDAKALKDEYRRISNLYIWKFDMSVARKNQPLESPELMRRVDKQIKRNEISDPNQIIPYLKEISGDEMFPLITRNHAKRLLKHLEKNIKKEKASN